jgi:hypothetical protein
MAAHLIIGTLVAWHVGALIYVYRLVGAGVMPIALINGVILVAWLMLLLCDGHKRRR